MFRRASRLLGMLRAAGRSANPAAAAPSPDGPTDPVASGETGAALLAFFNEQLTREYNRRTALDTRAASVVVTSTTVATATVTLTTFAGAGVANQLGSVRWFLLAAVALFVCAALAGLVAYWPRTTEAAPVEVLDGWHTGARGLPLVQAQNNFAYWVLRELRPLRDGNKAKGVAVRIAGGLQIAGVMALAAGFATTVIGVV